MTMGSGGEQPRRGERAGDPRIAGLLRAAYATEIDVDVAARHLWTLHRAASRRARERPAWRRARQAAVSVLTAVVLVISSGGALAASASSLPGDVLYPVKRSAEHARIFLTASADADAQLHLDLARTRMLEARYALDRARPTVVPSLVSEAVDALEAAERAGGVAVAEEAAAVRREASAGLTALFDELHGEGRKQLEASAERLGAPPPAAVEEVADPPPAPPAPETGLGEHAEGATDGGDGDEQDVTAGEEPDGDGPDDEDDPDSQTAEEPADDAPEDGDGTGGAEGAEEDGSTAQDGQDEETGEETGEETEDGSEAEQEAEPTPTPEPSPSRGDGHGYQSGEGYEGEDGDGSDEDDGERGEDGGGGPAPTPTPQPAPTEGVEPAPEDAEEGESGEHSDGDEQGVDEDEEDAEGDAETESGDDTDDTDDGDEESSQR